MSDERYPVPQPARLGADVVKGESADGAALWSALRSERRALDERTTAGGGRCGWPLQDDAEEAPRQSIGSI